MLLEFIIKRLNTISFRQKLQKEKRCKKRRRAVTEHSLKLLLRLLVISQAAPLLCDVMQRRSDFRMLLRFVNFCLNILIEGRKNVIKSECF